LGGPCACPLQLTINFYDGTFGRFTNFPPPQKKNIKYQNLGIHWQKASASGGLRPYRGFALGPTWRLPSLRPPGPPPFAHSKYATDYTVKYSPQTV